MANLENLTEDNCEELKKFFETKIKPENPLATLEIYKMVGLCPICGSNACPRGKDMNAKCSGGYEVEE